MVRWPAHHLRRSGRVLRKFRCLYTCHLSTCRLLVRNGKFTSPGRKVRSLVFLLWRSHMSGRLPSKQDFTRLAVPIKIGLGDNVTLALPKSFSTGSY